MTLRRFIFTSLFLCITEGGHRGCWTPHYRKKIRQVPQFRKVCIAVGFVYARATIEAKTSGGTVEATVELYIKIYDKIRLFQAASESTING